MTKMEKEVTDQAAILESVRKTNAGKVKVGFTDIDGVVRGKYMHMDKFFSSVEGGFGFCDVVFGWDVNDQPYDNAYMTGWHRGFPDANARLDLDTYRKVPWENNVPFFLGEFVKGDGSPYPLCPRQVLKRVLARAEKMGFGVMCGVEYEFFNFRETPEGWAARNGPPQPITSGMFGYSLLRTAANREYFTALMDDMAKFRIPLEGLHTETGPGVYEAAIMFSNALEAADRGVLFKLACKEIAARFGIMPTFMAKWHPKYPGSSGHIHQSLTDGRKNLFYDPKGKHNGMSKLFESYLAGQVAFLMEFGPMFWPTINSYKRLVDGFWAPVKPTWGVDNRTASFRALPGSPKSTRIETRCPGADMNAYLGIAAVVAAGLEGVKKGLKLTMDPITGDNVGGDAVVRAPRTLIETTRIFHASKLAREWFGPDFVDHFAATREWEWRQWLDTVTDWEMKRYFEII